jgi:L-arabonate dehydrase
MTTPTKKPLRSQLWFGKLDKDGFAHRSWMKNQGYPNDLFDGRPVIGICNTWSETNPCNGHFREIAEFVKRGVYEAGGFPLEFPVMSLGETLMRPTAMLFRNLASMDVEESIRANPLDGVVLLMGCDKTTPSLIMGAASCDIPTIGLSGGPMLKGRYQGQTLGSGTGVWQMSEKVRGGFMTNEEFMDAEAGMHRSKGHCMTMGTASTMASMVEALGLSLPGNAAIPAVDAHRFRLAQLTGRRIVDMVKEDICLSQILTRKNFENAIRTNAAIGGSTNAVIHLLAIAGRLGVPLSLADFDDLGRNMPNIVDIQPNGQYLMEDFYYAGGLPAVMNLVSEHLHLDTPTANGKTLGENIKDAKVYDDKVILNPAKPFMEKAGIAVLTGNLAPDGCIIKPSAATPALMQHRGRAVVFSSIEDFKIRIEDEALDIDENSVMVLQNCGPKGYPGMAEVGNMPLPPKVLRKGITDMVRISDARMSGTAYGTVILHVAPEAAAGGPLALVKTGDMIEVDVANRRIHLEVSEEELAARKATWVAPKPWLDRGYIKLYIDHVQQANTGCDLDFLVGKSGTPTPRESH